MNPVAVLIPVFNNQSGLDRTLSGLRGAVGGFDVVVVDDGSPRPIEVPTGIGPGRTVVLMRLALNSGISAALNHGLQYILSRGYQYVARLDSGDTVAGDRFQRQCGFLDSHPDHGVVSSIVDFVDEAGELVFRYRAPCQHSRIVRRLHLGNCIIHSASMIRATALQRTGVYKEDVPGAEDYDLFLRIARHYQLAVLPNVLTRCEYTVTGLSIAGRARQQLSRLGLQLRHFDAASVYSFAGIARTLIAMLVPHGAVYRLKRAFLR